MIQPQVDEVVRSDLLVVGGGLAGCQAALAAREAGVDRVVLVDKGRVGRSGQSPLAAGSFAVFYPDEDDYDLWMQETIEAGEYMNDQAWAGLFLKEIYPIFLRLTSWEAEDLCTIFERDEQGRYIRRTARGHTHRKANVVNAIPLMDVFRKRLVGMGVHLREKVAITDLVVEDGRLLGAIGFSPVENKTYLFLSRATVLAASGCGFKSIFIGHRPLTGDLQAAAFEAGATFQNMEFTLSNTCAKNFDIHGLNLFVGMGGIFLNGEGAEFMWDYRPDLGNRAGLPDLAISFCQEVREGRGPIYLDLGRVTPPDQGLLRKVLPETFILWDRAGVNPFEERIEWVPAFLGTIANGGGIRVNLDCETDIPGLYAAGDITNEPSHGTDTAGGIHLPFALVSGRIAGRRAADFARHSDLSPPRPGLVEEKLCRLFLPIVRGKGISPDEAIARLQEALIPYRYSYIRSEESLVESRSMLLALEGTMEEVRARNPHELLKCLEASRMLKVARMIVEAAYLRRESRGFHFRVDFPRTDNVNWLKWVMVRSENGGVKTWAETVPTPYLAPGEEYSLPPGHRRR